MYATQHVHHSRLSGTVVADERENLVLVYFEVDVFERDDTPESFLDILQSYLHVRFRPSPSRFVGLRSHGYALAAGMRFLMLSCVLYRRIATSRTKPLTTCTCVAGVARTHQSSESREDAAYRVDGDGDAVGVDADGPRRILVAAERVHLLPELGVLHRVADDDERDDGDQDGEVGESNPEAGPPVGPEPVGC